MDTSVRPFRKIGRQAVVDGGAERHAAIFPKLAYVLSKTICEAAIAAAHLRTEFPDVLIACRRCCLLAHHEQLS